MDNRDNAPRGLPPAPSPFAPVWPGATPASTPAGAPPAPPTWPALQGEVVAGPVIAEGVYPDSGQAERRSSFGGPLAKFWVLIIAVLAKLKYLVFLLKFKAFGTFITMLVSVWAYALLFGPAFAVGLVLLLFVHEMGHVVVLRAQGVKASAPIFIPFMGALIGMREMPKNAFNEAKVALGGPIAGSLGALACLMLWQSTGSPLFIALTYFGCWLNLFNLIPVSPLDGGRAMAAISPWGWLVGLGLLVVLFFRVHSLFLGFILVIGAIEVFKRWQGRRYDQSYYELTGAQRLTITAAYFGLAIILALSMFALQPHLINNQPL
ncbi:MAG: site-2 protease family protein [Thermomicrobiales bacterium]